MHTAVDGVLARRHLAIGGSRRLAPPTLSVLLHLLIIASVLLGPGLSTPAPAPVEFVAVQIVPLAALGVPDPPASTPSPPPRSPAPLIEEEEASEADEVAESPDVMQLPEPEAVRKIERQPAASEVALPTPSPDNRRLSGPARRQGSPFGSSTGTSPFGAAIGGLDNPDFRYSYYIDQMLAMIGSHWTQPSIGGQIETVIHFRIHKNGEISEVRIARSSGFNSYDLAGLRAIQLAAPFPRLPQSYKQSSLGVNFVFRSQ